MQPTHSFDLDRSILGIQQFKRLPSLWVLCAFHCRHKSKTSLNYVYVSTSHVWECTAGFHWNTLFHQVVERNGIFRKIFRNCSYIIHSTQSMLLFYFSELSSLLVMDAWHSQLQLKFQHRKNVSDGWIFRIVLVCCFVHSWRRSWRRKWTSLSWRGLI